MNGNGRSWGDVALSWPSPARRSDLLHRRLDAARQPAAGGTGRGFMRCREGDAGGTAFYDRRMGGLARSPALHLALARGGLRLWRPVGSDQGAVFTSGERNGGVEPPLTLLLILESRSTFRECVAMILRHGNYDE